MKIRFGFRRTALLLITGMAITAVYSANAHCDTLDGPVVAAAKLALEKREVSPVLKWVKADVEAEIKQVFSKALAVRANGEQARELADQFFFETLVRLHRQGEGAPYTGLKPAGTNQGSMIAAADRAMESGDVEGLVKQVTAQAEKGVRERFAAVTRKRAHAEHNVEAGRSFVAAYVDYIHHVEGLATAAAGGASHEAHVAQDGQAASEHQH